MIEVEVLISNFKDKENKHLGLLQPGYVYKVTKERYEELSKQGIVKKHIEPKKEETKGE